jgi:uncharacterized membrane protein YdjX (TVP38/TMEM64 family)
MNPKLKSLLELLIIVIIFIIITYVVQTNLIFFESLIGKNINGILIYLLVVILAMVVAPITSIPLIPLMSNIWGWVFTGVISIIGWTIGAIIVFLLCRRYGVDIIKKLISLNDIYALEKKFPKENLFLIVLFLRMIIPVDILSYALGLFTKMKFWPYTIATFIGIIPAAFLLAYVGSISAQFQIIVFLIVGIIFMLGWIIQEKK